jgi:predicted nucleotidyltransferase
MDSGGIQEIVRYFQDYLEKNGIADAKVRIFGSYAWGTPHEESDVDVAIISRSFAEKGPFERAAMITGLHIDAVARFRMPFDIVTFSPSEYASEQSPIASYVREAETSYKP